MGGGGGGEIRDLKFNKTEVILQGYTVAGYTIEAIKKEIAER